VKKASILGTFLLILSTMAGQAEVLYSGGQWDFESGFYYPTIYDRIGGVGNGWQWWSDKLEYNGETYGFGNLNENKNMANVSSGVRSQEITMTWSTGWAGIYRTFDVPAGHRIRVEYDAKTTWSETLAVVYLGINLDGGTDHSRTSPTTTWYPWGHDWGPESPPGVFYHMSQTVISTGPRMTVFLAELHEYPSRSGATEMLDNVQVFDDGSIDAPTPTPPEEAPSPSVMTR